MSGPSSSNGKTAARKADVLLVGPYPPPLGGVSAHIKRLAEAIQDGGLTVGVLNHFRTGDGNPLIVGALRRNPLRYWSALRRVNQGVVHYHHSRWSTLMATAIALSREDRPATAITVHGHELDRYLAGSRPLARLTRLALGRFDTVIAVSPDIAKVLERALPKRSVPVIPAYLPATRDADSVRSSRESHAFLKAGHPTLIVAAYGLMVDGSGKTIYGLEFALDAFIALAADHPRLRLAVFLAQGPRSRAERKRMAGLQERATAAGLSDRFHISVGEALVPAFSYECVFLRPSTTDGDAVAIREALEAGKQVIASDVVARPAGVESLPLQLDAWNASIMSAIEHPQDRPSLAHASDQASALMGIYRSLLP